MKTINKKPIKPGRVKQRRRGRGREGDEEEKEEKEEEGKELRDKGAEKEDFPL